MISLEQEEEMRIIESFIEDTLDRAITYDLSWIHEEISAIEKEIGEDKTERAKKLENRIEGRYSAYANLCGKMNFVGMDWFGANPVAEKCGDVLEELRTKLLTSIHLQV